MPLETLKPAPPPGQEHVLLVGGSPRTLDLLRLATVRSENVLLVSPFLDEAVSRYARHFGVTVESRRAQPDDSLEAELAIISTDSFREDSRVLRFVRHHGVPVHVFGQPQLCDFTLMGMLEWHPSSQRRRHARRPEPVWAGPAGFRPRAPSCKTDTD
jgi:siroheme synthase (precorrin-2 oxidase/ferrochelatase)